MYYIMDELRNKIMQFEGSVYEQRVREKPEFYQFIQKELDETFEFHRGN